MLEIIALFFLTRQIGQLAQQKGLKKGMWKLHTVLLWFGGEIAGAIIGIILFGQDNLIPVMIFGYLGAIAAFLVLKYNLSSQPDAVNDPFDFE